MARVTVPCVRCRRALGVAHVLRDGAPHCYRCALHELWDQALARGAVGAPTGRPAPAAARWRSRRPRPLTGLVLPAPSLAWSLGLAGRPRSQGGRTQAARRSVPSARTTTRGTVG